MDTVCLLRSVNALSIQLRCDAINVIAGDWTKYGVFTETRDGNPYKDAKSYYQAMYKRIDPAYGGAAEIMALAALHCVRVCVYEEDVFVMEEDVHSPHTVSLWYDRQMKHYKALLPVIEDECEVFENKSASSDLSKENTYPVSCETSISDEFFSDFSDCSFESSMVGPCNNSCQDLSEELCCEPFSIGSVSARSFNVTNLSGYVPCRPSCELPRHTMPQGTYTWARLYRDETTSNIDLLDVGGLNIVCDRCGAFFWHAERKADGKSTPAWCCGDTVYVDLSVRARFDGIKEPAVYELYFGTSDDAVHFRRHARAYNFMLSLGMPSAKYERRLVMGESVIAVNGKATFQVPTRPQMEADGLPAQPGQLYFVDMTSESVAKRIRKSSDQHLRPHIVEILEGYLRRHNPLVQTCLLAKEVMEKQDAASLEQSNQHERRSGLHLLVNPHRDGVRSTDRALLDEDGTALRPPHSEFVAAVFEGEEPRYNYDVAIYPRIVESKSYVLVNENSPTIDILMYSLIHLHGEDSWVNILESPSSEKRRRRDGMRSTQVGSLRAYYASRLLRRGDPSQSLLFRLRGLYQQFVADAGVKIEDANLRYAREHQDELNVCMYDSLKRYVEDVANARGTL